MSIFSVIHVFLRHGFLSLSSYGSINNDTNWVGWFPQWHMDEEQSWQSDKIRSIVVLTLSSVIFVMFNYITMKTFLSQALRSFLDLRHLRLLIQQKNCHSNWFLWAHIHSLWHNKRWRRILYFPYWPTLWPFFPWSCSKPSYKVNIPINSSNWHYKNIFF